MFWESFSSDYSVSLNSNVSFVVVLVLVIKKPKNCKSCQFLRIFKEIFFSNSICTHALLHYITNRRNSDLCSIRENGPKVHLPCIVKIRLKSHTHSIHHRLVCIHRK